ncbi:hypothetical protein ABZY45_19740 [Streptomyces sp. NPDC006516]|uniref:hypothetical protein n=1 Tax=Streptomyces sp. NPDC006516 TaxID=3154309 RepID=UPI0033BE8086
MSALDTHRLTLQRTNEWIYATLRQLAADEPQALRIEGHGSRMRYVARSRPKR